MNERKQRNKKTKKKKHFLEEDFEFINRGKHIRKPKPRPTIRHKGVDEYNRRDKSWLNEEE
jgi:hypothetical protein